MSVITKSIAIEYGTGPKLLKFSIDWATMVAAIGAAVSGDVPLFTLPAYSIIHTIIVKHSAVFAGVGGTLKVSVGKTGSATLLTAATADLVATAVADATYQKTNNPDQGTMAALAIVLNVVSTVGNVSTLTAGNVDVLVEFCPPSTPTV